MAKQKTIAILSFITGMSFLVLFIYVYATNKNYKIEYIDFTPNAFVESSQSVGSLSDNKTHNISYQKEEKRTNYNIGNIKFSIYSEKSNNSYILKINYNNRIIPLMTFYEKPFFKYGLFDDKKSFWIITNSTINPGKYQVLAFYSIDNPVPIRLYESESESQEVISQLSIHFAKDYIKINSSIDNVKISKYGEVSNLNN